MYKDKKIGVVIPAHDEEKLIGRVIETMPDFVDKIIIVDDASKDKTVEVVEKYMHEAGESKLILLKHNSNRGVGGAIVTGYKKAFAEDLDVIAVMAGDAQMDPDELDKVIEPVVEGKADYVKGNRLYTGRAWEIIPRHRYLGNAFLSLLTKVASGYWHVSDSQCGYTAISREVLEILRLDKLYCGYGFPNHMLTEVNIYHFRVKDVPIKPIYGIGEKSGIRLWKVVPSLSCLLFRCFFWRLKEKYIIRDFHPLVFFYFLGFTLFPAGLIYGIYLIYLRIFIGPVAPTSALFAVFLFISGLQSLFFAMWFDMEYNKSLK